MHDSLYCGGNELISDRTSIPRKREMKSLIYIKIKMQIPTAGSRSSVIIAIYRANIVSDYLELSFPNVKQRWCKGLVVGIQMAGLQQLASRMITDIHVNDSQCWLS